MTVNRGLETLVSLDNIESTAKGRSTPDRL